jgi:hypothetical protein
MHLDNLRRLGRTLDEERVPRPTPPVPRPPSPESPQGRAHAAREALSGLEGAKLANVVYSIVADHPGLSADQLHSLANRLSRAADEKERR